MFATSTIWGQKAAARKLVVAQEQRQRAEAVERQEAERAAKADAERRAHERAVARQATQTRVAIAEREWRRQLPLAHAQARDRLSAALRDRDIPAAIEAGAYLSGVERMIEFVEHPDRHRVVAH
jgi:hypothetical protein